MDIEKLLDFYEKSMAEAKAANVLFSLQLKATVLKVSDSIMFGHAVKLYFKEVFTKYKETFSRIGVDANNGLADLSRKVITLPVNDRKSIDADIYSCYNLRGDLVMSNPSKSISNLYSPGEVVIDVSMPAAIRDGGKMLNRDNREQDFMAAIPDRSYACVFHEMMEFCKEHGAFDPSSMGACPTVGLVAQGAEEYGSNPTTFEISNSGVICVVKNDSDEVLMSHKVGAGDIYRFCQTKDEPVRDWVKLAVKRCRANEFPKADEPCKAIFWLDSARAHDALMIEKVERYISTFQTKDLDIEIMAPADAMRLTCQRAKKGSNTVAVTGNVLQDYLADLFPVLELGTSAKIFSTIRMLSGAVMYESAAGVSAPRLVQQFAKESHLRWDSLGEYLALSCSLVGFGKSIPKAKVLGDALRKAAHTYLAANKVPSQRVKTIDNRGSQYWLVRYWAEELAKQEVDMDLKATFEQTAIELANAEVQVLTDFIDCQGTSTDIGGHYWPDRAKVKAAMNPSETFNSIIENLAESVSPSPTAAPMLRHLSSFSSLAESVPPSPNTAPLLRHLSSLSSLAERGPTPPAPAAPSLFPTRNLFSP
jgi:isocitrate dehydrogenase